MSWKVTTFVLLVLALTMTFALFTSAYAISGSSESFEGYDVVVSGKVNIIVDESGRICGITSPTEDIKKLGYQDSGRKSIKGIVDGEVTRRHAYASILLDENFYIKKGARECDATIYISDPETVAEILNADVYEAYQVIDATVFSPTPTKCGAKIKGSHICLLKKSDRHLVGVVVLGCGQALDLYAGHFDDDCDEELGFKPHAQSAPEPKSDTCQPQQCQPYNPCIPAQNCNPCGTVQQCQPYNPCQPVNYCNPNVHQCYTNTTTVNTSYSYSTNVESTTTITTTSCK